MAILLHDICAIVSCIPNYFYIFLTLEVSKAAFISSSEDARKKRTEANLAAPSSLAKNVDHNSLCKEVLFSSFQPWAEACPDQMKSFLENFPTQGRV